jgi:hypothetical protein
MGDQGHLFYRCSTDGRVFDCSHLENSYGGVAPSSVWIVGGGPSLLSAPTETIKESPAPKFGVNLAGRGPDGEWPLIRPTMWTCFDPTARFHRSIFLDASIQKFLLGGRRMDLIPDGTEKACECPNMYFVNHETRGYLDSFGQEYRKILHMLDSLVQAVDIAFRLGFRKLYCVGTDMRIRPSEAQIAFAESLGVVYDRERGWTVWTNDKKVEVRSDRLSDFRDRVKEMGEVPGPLDGGSGTGEGGAGERQYSFDESKRFMAACACDNHYWDRIQYLRQCRRTMALNGLQLISCTPGSRLNDWFPYMDPFEAAKSILRDVGDPSSEISLGAYSGDDKPGSHLPFHKDIDPYGWKDRQQEKPAEKPVVVQQAPNAVDRREEIASQLARVGQKKVVINEEGGLCQQAL